MKFGLLPSIFIVLLCSAKSVTGQERHQCARLQKPWNGHIVGDCNRYLGAQCVFECRQPYVLVGSRVRVCQQDGLWSGQTAGCELDSCVDCGTHHSDCPALRNPEGGYTEGQCNPGVTGQTCTFRCNQGYTLHGQARLTCQTNGQWNSQSPHCDRRTAALCDNFNVANGYANCNAQGEMTVCRVTCNEGYTLIGSSVVTCSASGTWTDQLPACQRINGGNTCPTLYPPSGGRLVGRCSSAVNGDTCQLVCLSGYRPNDLRVLVCQNNGVWSNTLPRCIGGECPSINVPRGSTSGTCNPGQAGQSCTITCNPGSTLNGRSTLFCGEDGRWSDNIPFCSSVATCPDLPIPANGAHSGYCSRASAGQTCSFSCQPGFTLAGSSNALCRSDGTWSSIVPTCVRSSPDTCSNLIPPDNGYIIGVCSPGVVGQSCTFACEGNHILIGDRTLTCLSSGSWSHRPPICETGNIEEAGCPILTPPPNGEFVECDNRYGGRCVVVCHKGYIRAGSRVRTCLAQGTWTGFSPTCTRRAGYTYTYKVVPLWSLIFG